MGGQTERTVSIIIKAKDDATSAFDNIVRSVTSIQGVALLAAAAVAGLAYAFAKVTDAAAEQEIADVKLAAALRSVGENTAANRQHLNTFITQLEDLTGVSDETISSAVGLIAQLARLSGAPLEDATRNALDLSAALGIDLEQAATMVARATEGNVQALRRYGIVIDETLPKSQQAAEAARRIHEQFGGMAEAMGGTVHAAFVRIANDFDNLEQALGKAVIENETFRALLEIISDLLKRATGFVADHSTAIQTLTTWTSRAAIAVIRFGVENVNQLARSIQSWTTLTELVLGFALKVETAGPLWLKKALGIDEGDVLGIAEKIGKLVMFLEQIRETAQAVGDSTSGALDDIQKRLEAIGKGVHDTAAGLGKGVPPATEKLGELDQILKDLGADTMPQLAAMATEVDRALVLLSQNLAAGNLTPEQYDHILEVITQITQKLPQWTDDSKAALMPLIDIRDVLMEISDVLDQQLQESTLRFSDTLIDGAFGAKIAWGQFFKQMLADLAKAIARALIMKFIFEAFSGGLGGSFGDAQAAADVGAGADFGLESSTVLGSIRPVAAVFPTAQSASPGFAAAASAGVNTQPGAGPSASGLIQMFNQIVPIRNREAELADLITGMNEFVERKGFRLVASHVLA